MKLNEILKLVLNNIKANMAGEKIGYTFNSKLFNNSSSSVSVAISGINIVKTSTKCAVSVNIPSKLLYGTSATLHSAACVSSGLCLVTRHSPVSPLPLTFSSLALVTSFGGHLFNRLGECMDPTLSPAAIEACIDQIAKEF